MCLVFRDRRLTWAEVTERTRRLANYLLGRRPRRAASSARSLPGHESGQDHLAIYLHNGNEYLEAMLGAFKARVAPFNVNYRYVAEELRYLLDDAGGRGHRRATRQFAPTLAEVLPDLPDLARAPAGRPTTSGNDAAARRRCWYEDALAAASRRPPAVDREPRRPLHPLHRRHHGMPKGVLWRNGDAIVECFGGSPTARHARRGRRRGRPAG